MNQDELGGACGARGEVRNVFNIFVGQTECKISLGRPQCRWGDNNMDLREIDWKDVNFNHLAQEWFWALVNTAMNLRVS
jgi:hypothetical protein